MSIRVRLTLWYVVVLCLGLAVFAGAVVWQTGRSAHAAFDQALQQRGLDVRADLRFSPALVLRPDAPDESGPQPGDTTLWIRVLTPRGQVVVRQGPPVLGVPSRVLADMQPGMHDHELAGERRVQIFVLPVVRHGRRVATVQIITTTAQMDTARRQLLAAMGLAGGAIVVIAALGGLFLADRTLRPVDRITRLAAQIGASDLHRRVSEAVWGPASHDSRRTDELTRLARTFDGMLARLEDANDRRRRLTADAAHELATPIATIASGAEIALRHPRSAGEYRAALQHVLDESRHMGRMVDDLLLLARADAGRLPVEHELVEIDEVCRQVLHAVHPLAVARAVSLTATLPSQALLVRGDAVRLGQVIRNLLDNALRYTPPGGAVTLTLTHDAGRAGAVDRVILRVSDTGPGVAPRDRERIFERFHRVDTGAPSASEGPGRAGGSGLGLAICKAIVLAHQGQIRVESSALGDTGPQSSGAQFVIELPGIAEVSAGG